MAWIEQTKKGSRKSGGPQYYLQNLAEHTQELLRAYGRRPVRLWTPYGVVDSGLEAVSSKVGAVGHDRVQSGGKVGSIADQIAHWYGLERMAVERIEFEDSFDRDSFVIRPSHVKFFGRRSRKTLYPDSHPLTIIEGHRSHLYGQQIRNLGHAQRSLRSWAEEQIRGIVEEHQRAVSDVDERDLLRTAGALSLLGIRLGMYRTRGIDCPDATFRAGSYPPYPCPIEIEEKSSGFLAGHHGAHRKQRVVVLCMIHDAREVLTEYVDIIELRELDRLLKDVA